MSDICLDKCPFPTVFYLISFYLKNLSEFTINISLKFQHKKIRLEKNSNLIIKVSKMLYYFEKMLYYFDDEGKNYNILL